MKICKKLIDDVYNYIGYYDNLDYAHKIKILHNHNVYWDLISHYKRLSEDFIREFQDNVDWFYVSSDQKLSEDFIREFQNKVYWNNIFNYQQLSLKFKDEFRYRT